MRINADFSIVAVVNRNDAEWIASPESGVDRIMLDRIGDEVARATSIVQYAPGSSFARHEHAKGEEFLVLDGVFSDESGDFAAGAYVRNPPGSGHTPFSRDGCRILVKLRQFDDADLERVVVDTRIPELWLADESADRLPLHQYGSEIVSLLRIPAGREHALAAHPGGTELFVVNGTLRYGGTDLPAESWLRLPPGEGAELAAPAECVLWMKRGHLPPVPE